MLFHAIDNTAANCLNQLVVVRVLREITHAGKGQTPVNTICPFSFRERGVSSDRSGYPHRVEIDGHFSGYIALVFSDGFAHMIDQLDKNCIFNNRRKSSRLLYW